MTVKQKWLAAVLLLICGCNSSASKFDQEINLAKRAALGQLNDDEKQKLLAENHPVLLQVSDPNIRRLLKMFAELPNEQQTELREKKFLKWRFTDLDKYRQQVFKDVLTMNLKLLSAEDISIGTNKVLALLSKSELGFAVVDIPSSGESVVSCYVLWPDRLSPTWVGVANSKALKASDATEAHMLRLPMLKNFKTSRLPSGPSIDDSKNNDPDLLIPAKGTKSQLFTKSRLLPTR
ncbi:MAG: hypothetical protein ABL921_02600 [Pirellula sp.]